MWITFIIFMKAVQTTIVVLGVSIDLSRGKSSTELNLILIYFLS